MQELYEFVFFFLSFVITRNYEVSPEDDTVSDRLEESVRVGIHGQDVLAVRVVFQRRVDPVCKGNLLFLCRSQANIRMIQKKNKTVTERGRYNVSQC